MSKKMCAAVFSGPEKVDFRDIPLPEPGNDEVRIKLHGCGVCASNLPVWQGRDYFDYPFAPGAPGHEGWGIIDDCGADVHNFEPGQPVAAVSYNAYAEYDVAPADSIVPLPEHLADRPFPAEPLGCAVNVLKRSQIQPGDSVAIVGIGFLGAILTSIIHSQGNNVIAISRRPYALSVAKDCGAAYTIQLADEKAIQSQVHEITNGKGCDVVIEAVGTQGPLDLASKLTKTRGRLVVAGYHQDGKRQINMQLWNWRGLDVINAHERDNSIYISGIEQAIELVDKGIVPVDGLISSSYRLNELDQAMRDMQNRPDGYLKGYIEYD